MHLKHGDGRVRPGPIRNCTRLPMNVRGLTAHEVFELSTHEVEEILDLSMAGRYQPVDLAALLVEAAAREVSPNQAAKDLGASMSESNARHHLGKLEIDRLIERVNARFTARYAVLPNRPLQAASDNTEVCFYGDAQNPRMHDFLRRGKAKRGTNNFLVLASLYVILDHRRFTLALLPVRRGEAAADVLERLIQIARDGGVRIEVLFLDRGYDSGEVMARLQALEQPYCLMGRITGKEGGNGTRALCRGRTRKVRRARKLKDGTEVTSTLCIVRKWQKGKMGKHGAKYHLYYTWRCRIPINRIYNAYRGRFGIETSYRQKDDARVRTTSTDPVRRFLFAAVGFLLVNLWVFLKWTRVSVPRPGRVGKKVFAERFSLETMLVFLTVVCGERYDRRLEVVLPPGG